jgi:hypothetical protein
MKSCLIIKLILRQLFFTCKDQRERRDKGYRIDWIGPKIAANRNRLPSVERDELSKL